MSEKREKYRGLFTVLEGPDGSGKLTQATCLQEEVQRLSKYADVIRTHEPWRSKEIKEKLKKDRDSFSDGARMAELYIDDRVKHTKHLIRPVLEAGSIALCDRYKMSTCAYQWVQGVELHELLRLHEERGILTPDITFLLQINLETFRKRVEERGGELEKFERNTEFIGKLINAYAALGYMAQVDEGIFGKVTIIDGNRKKEDIAREIKEKFVPYYERWAGQNLATNLSPGTITIINETLIDSA